MNDASLSVDRLHVVFKIVERCNINCTYCYYFNMGDSTALNRPAIVSIESAAQTASWLADSCSKLHIRELVISFHGGEPMMMKADVFSAICRTFEDHLASLVRLSFNIQTNGTILSDKWISAFVAHSVHVGVSVDGDKTANDRSRLDRKGRSTFIKTEQTLLTLLGMASSTPTIGPSVIAVLDHRNDYRAVYHYLRDLGVRQLSFLLPDRNFDDGFAHPDESAWRYGEILYQIFEAWMIEDDPDVYVRFIAEFLADFQIRSTAATSVPDQSLMPSLHSSRHWARQVLIVHSDGTVNVSDSYIPALSWYSRTASCSIHNSSLRDFLANDLFEEIEYATRSLPAKCKRCEWKRVCRAGDIENRYSKQNGFDNPSAYCDGYQWFFDRARNLLIANGLPAQRVEQVLSGHSSKATL